MIVAAKTRFYVQSPFFILDETIAEALKTAALAGIDVRVMVSEKGFGNWVPYWAANTFFREVAEAGVRVFRYHGGYLHSKIAITDGEICSVGTANIDIRSFSINYELNAVIYDEAIARRLEEDFARDLAECTEFTIEDYQQAVDPDPASGLCVAAAFAVALIREILRKFRRFRVVLTGGGHAMV